MLRTSTWTNAHGNGNVIVEPSLIIDFEEEEKGEPIPAHGITSHSYPEKPYVYGRSTAYARRQLLRAQLQLNRTRTT